MIQKLTKHKFEDLSSVYKKKELHGYILQYSKTYISSPITKDYIPCTIKVDGNLVYVYTDNGVYAWPIEVFNDVGLFYNDNKY